MGTVEKVAEWVEKDLAWLQACQAASGRKLLVAPQLIISDHGQFEDVKVVVARKRNRVVYFDVSNDEFAIGKAVNGKIELDAFYGDFRYAIQELISDEVRAP